MGGSERARVASFGRDLEEGTETGRMRGMKWRRGWRRGGWRRGREKGEGGGGTRLLERRREREEEMEKKVEVGGECQVLYGGGRRIESKLPPQHSSRRSSGRLYRACRRRMRDVGWDGAGR
ncbi:hypothetical protein HZH66_010270 [Vespula vulgaris]|uniref:Uncharacterized protein n=1 Tax=Vespula vulgaris TaxID=7454 RepID=A0A834MZZ9_VESVU|nr:hypothetical protein HZH66_010270 [Vespula vulgaris]